MGTSEADSTDRDRHLTNGAARLTATVEEHEQAVHVVLAGELDLATLGIAEEALNSIDPDRALVLDLRNLSFLDSSGLRLILTASEAGEKGQRHVYVVRGPAQVDRVFELTGAGERLNLIDDPSSIARG